jgi:diadenosine tetraphosphatase ApaH/serine/threonine PP2A family protein phosphatase
MLIAVISDIHANLPALEEVLQKIEQLKADTIVCLGDTVGYGPFPNECVDLVRARCAVVLQGNHDSGLVGGTPIEDFNQYGLQAIQWTKTVVTKDNSAYLAGLSAIALFEGVTLAHASPDHPDAWNYVLTMRAAKDNFRAFDTRLCFIGHTHAPVVIGEDETVNTYNTDNRYIINVGSVGQPRDGNPDAAFGLHDTASGTYKLIRVSYDIDRTAAKMKEVKLPEFLANRLFHGT